MKYAENNRISHRQLYRQIVLSFAAPFLICIPGKNGVQGVNGALGIGMAVLILLVFVFWMLRSTGGYTDPVKYLGKTGGGILGLFFMVYLIMSGAYLLTLIEQIVPIWLISGISGKWLSFLAVAVCAYGMDRGMQRRGRLADVSGGMFLLIILLILLLCIGQGKTEYLRETWNEAGLDGTYIMRDAYGFLCAFSGIGLLPFAMKDIEKKGSTGKPIFYAILTVGGILMFVLFLLPAVLGWKRIQKEVYPILPLLAGADLPGNVLARFDVLWMGFLLYGILFALGSLFHYGNQILDAVHLGSGKYWMPLVVYLFFAVSWKGMRPVDFYGRYLGYIFVPGLLLIQIWMYLRGSHRRRKKAAAAIGLLLVLTMSVSGCAGIEPEKRMYPLAMGIDLEELNYVLSYGMPNLPQATGQGKDTEENAEVLTLRGNSFEEMQALYERSQEKYLDIGHLQILVVGAALLDSDRWEEFLEYLKKEPLAGENIYLFRAEKAENILNWSNSDTSLGEYLTGLMENRTSGQQKKGVTLREVYHQWYQYGTVPALPEIILTGEEIQVYLNETEKNVNTSGEMQTPDRMG
ncbi:GerAB/ArcD/ProY family transporter [Blautia sp. MSJ-19]|uniref:GerAB/ArcD/ProY family transporter n=1 Tax=Blautia sp. MSJ-19 TaxID=2841517 RepID=UPI001C0EEB3A|nr:GerAB/ArcD/ProY family transporter [Blautia sp. MSJ-19]MBU5482093.1 spore germination protein [Blautia sp. MSJ-19]